MNKMTNEVIKDNERYFNFYLIVPQVTTIILAIIYFIVGIIVAAIVEDGIWLLPFWLGGSVICLVTYVVLKLILSYKILHIYYLKKLAGEMDSQDKKTGNVQAIDSQDKKTGNVQAIDSLPEI